MDKGGIVDTVSEVDRVLANFVRGQLMVAFLMGALYSMEDL